jgi:hypothetical protein
MPALAHPATKSVPSLQDCDFEAMLQQDIGASQASESGSDDTDADRQLCSRHGRAEHGVLLFCVRNFAQIKVL